MPNPKLTLALQKAFEEVDKTKRGHIDAKEVEIVLKHYNANPEVIEKLDPANIKQEAAHFLTLAEKDKNLQITEKEFIDYYQNRLVSKW